MSTQVFGSHPSPGPGDNRHIFVVCTGEACENAGATGILQELTHRCQRAPGEVCVGSSECLGHCQLAPAIVEDGRILGGLSPRRLKLELMRLGLV